MIFTSVLGHLFESDFEVQGKWDQSDPKDLFKAKIVRRINPDHELVAKNIEQRCEETSLVIIWTDCDREGENIARQIESVIRPRSSVEIKRARFSAISRPEIERALQSLVDINEHEADAVDARMELDLRIGSAFTRIQTIAYSHGNVISFGPCQIPTLNFVVQRHLQIARFVSENFFSLQNSIFSRGKDGMLCTFRWERGNVFDKNCVIHFYNVLSVGRAVIVDKQVKKREKYAPLPLRTVEFQKVCSSYYKIDSHRLMDVAEKLYNSGYISYPRTETDSFHKNFGFSRIINKLKNDPKIGEYAAGFTFRQPRMGHNNDQAHTPIYPLRDGSDLQGDERKVFEFISRRFLGCVSENAQGLETEYTMEITGGGISEIFKSKGLKITEKNYLDVYIYDRWVDSEIGEFRVDEVVENNLEISEGQTTKPEYLTESELITLMDDNGIGTDATIHEHIRKIQTRGYARKERFKFIPETLGINLIKAYKDIGLPISEPTLRKNLEMNLQKVCENRKDKDELVDEEIREYTRIYECLEGKIDVFKRTLEEGGDQPPHSKSGARREVCEVPENRTNRQSTKKECGVKRRLEELDRGEDKACNKINSKTLKKRKQATNAVSCDCGEEARMMESRKRESAGKSFMTCHYFPKRCNFFAWKDGPAGREETQCIVNCLCGYEAQKKVANTEANRGREFYSCKKSYKKCKFFKWADEV